LEPHVEVKEQIFGGTRFSTRGSGIWKDSKINNNEKYINICGE
jgi:hypothetical protein